MSTEHADRFTHLRPLLFTIVYEILGSATESDDVLQDSYLRWAQVDLPAVRDEDCDSALLDGPRSIAFMQAQQKLFTAMAVLSWCVD